METCMVLKLSIKFILLVSDFNKFERRSFEVLLQLTHISSLAEQIFRSLSELVFKNLFALKVSTLGSLLELVAIVAVSGLEMVESVEQRLNLLFALFDFGVKLVTVSLQLFFLLGCLDYIVGLRVLALGLNFT